MMESDDLSVSISNDSSEKTVENIPEISHSNLIAENPGVPGDIDEDSAVQATDSETPKSTNATAGLFNLTALTSVTSAIPVASYLSYFSTPAATKVPEPDNKDVEPVKESAVPDGSNPNDPPPVPSSSTRTWTSWAGQTGLMAAGVGLTLASAGWDAIEVTKQSIEATTQTLVSGPDNTDSAEDKDYQALRSQQGAIEIEIPARSICRVPFLVAKGHSIIWQIMVRNFDIGFAVVLRRQGLGGAVEDELVAMKRHKCGEIVLGGRSVVDHSRHIVLVFDNTYSTLRPKKCVYRVQIGENLNLDHIIRADEPEPPSVADVVVHDPAAQGQLARLSGLLDHAKVTYDGLVDKARQAGEVGIGQLQGGIGAVVVGGPMLLQRAQVIVASLRKVDPAASNAGAASTTATSTAEIPVVTIDESDKEGEAAVLSAAMDMSEFCSIWVQLEAGSNKIEMSVVPKPSLQIGFPLESLPEYLTRTAGLLLIACGEVEGGCQIFGHTAPEPVADGGESVCDFLLEMGVTWKGPSAIIEGQDEWTLKMELRTRSLSEESVAKFANSLKLEDVFHIM